jgi:hypothetical protein
VPCFFLVRRIKFLSGALGQVSAVQSGAFTGKVMTVHLPTLSESPSLPSFSVVAHAALGKLFPVSLQIELQYQCRLILFSIFLTSCLLMPIIILRPVFPGALLGALCYPRSSSGFGNCLCSASSLRPPATVVPAAISAAHVLLGSMQVLVLLALMAEFVPKAAAATAATVIIA